MLYSQMGDETKLSMFLQELAIGNNQALSDIYDMLGGRLFHIALGIVCDRNAANDVLQDSLIALAKGAKSYKYSKNPYGFICKIVNNTALNYLKKERRRGGVDLDSIGELTSSDNVFQEIENSDSVASILNSLDSSKRRIIMLKYFSQMTVREIADVVKMSKSAVQRNIDTAEEVLRQRLQEVEYV